MLQLDKINLLYCLVLQLKERENANILIQELIFYILKYIRFLIMIWQS